MAVEPEQANRKADADVQRRADTSGAAGLGPAQLAAAGNRALGQLLARPGAAPAEAPVPVQRDLVSDVESKMSYGAFDWEVTDEEATDSLRMLAALSLPALNAAMTRLSQTAKTRLLDNLPDAAKRTSGFAKVLVAMGPDAVQPYVQGLLSYGVFDWAITDSDAEQVFRIFMALQPAQQRTFATRLGAGFRSRLADNLSRNAVVGEAEQAAVRALFDATPDAEAATLRKWIKVRFRIEVGTDTQGGETPEAWDGPSLRRLYNVLQSLPPGAVETNPELLRIDRYRATGAAGGYYGSDRRVALGYGDIRSRDSVVDATNPGGSGMGVIAGLQGQNLFDGVVRHEVGHAVDARLGLAASYCMGNPAGGNWTAHGAGSGLAATMVTASGGTISTLPAVQKTQITNALQRVINDRTPEQVQTRLEALPLWAGLTAPQKAAILADKAVVALRVSFADKNPGNPWYRPTNDGGIHLGTRVFVESYAHRWHSYDVAARSRMLSKYQFRAPGEWIAEVYNYYYAPPTKGAHVAAVDGPTKAWFDVNVDEATGGEGAAGTGPALPPAATGPGYP